MKTAILTATLLVCASGAALAQDAMTAPQVRAKLEAAGYTKVHDVKFEHGLWSADARSGTGKKIDVRIDPASGEVYTDEQTSALSAADISAKLAAAGYTNVHDVKFDDGLWKADATDAAGKKLELYIEPKAGKVIGRDTDD